MPTLIKCILFYFIHLVFIDEEVGAFTVWFIFNINFTVLPFTTKLK